MEEHDQWSFNDFLSLLLLFFNIKHKLIDTNFEDIVIVLRYKLFPTKVFFCLFFFYQGYIWARPRVSQALSLSLQSLSSLRCYVPL